MYNADALVSKGEIIPAIKYLEGQSKLNDVRLYTRLLAFSHIFKLMHEYNINQGVFKLIKPLYDVVIKQFGIADLSSYATARFLITAYELKNDYDSAMKYAMIHFNAYSDKKGLHIGLCINDMGIF